MPDVAPGVLSPMMSFRHYKKKVLYIARYFSRNMQEVDREIMDNVALMALWTTSIRRSPRMKEGAFWSYIRTAVNRAMKRECGILYFNSYHATRRISSRFKKVLMLGDKVHRLKGEHRSTAISQMIVKEEVESILKDIPLLQRKAFILHYGFGLTSSQIERKLHLSEGRAEGLVNASARRALKIRGMRKDRIRVYVERYIKGDKYGDIQLGGDSVVEF